MYDFSEDESFLAGWGGDFPPGGAGAPFHMSETETRKLMLTQILLKFDITNPVPAPIETVQL